MTTGIGGAPSPEFAWRCDVPYLVELVSQGETLASSQLPASWPAFLDELQRRRSPFAKVQVPGPASSGRDPTERALFFVRQFQAIGVTPLVFIDEPMLVLNAALPALRELRDSGAIVGVHCCGNTDWARVLAVDFDVVSIDARLSLEALVEDRSAWRRWLASGAWLSLGIIPTNPGARYDVGELCESVEATFRATSPFPEILQRVMLTPACGFGLHAFADAERIMRELAQAQSLLRGFSPVG